MRCQRLEARRDVSLLRAQAEANWRRWNPKLVKQLQKSGKRVWNNQFRL